MSWLDPAQAVTLGEITVESALGQPLAARIPIDLGPGEVMGASCVSSPAAGKADLAHLPLPLLSVPETAVPGTYSLRVTTAQPLYEPMYELQVQVRCTGTTLLVRQYVLMLDLPGTASVLAAPAATTPATSVPVTAAPVPETPASPAPLAARPPHPRHPVTLGTPVAAGSTYRVAAGDTLSTIAARVSNRGGKGIWQLADLIFAANPDAFIGGNQDLIKLGSEISIPTLAPRDVPNVDMPPPATLPTEPAAVAQPAEPESVADSAPVAPEATPDAAAAPAAAPVFQDEQVAPSAKTAPPQDAPLQISSEPNRGDGPPPWLAALLGLLIGAGASLVLLRERLLEALRGLVARDTPAAAHVPARAPVPAQADRTLPPRESTMVVVEERHDDVETATAQTNRLAAVVVVAQPDAELDHELSSLFGDDADLHSLESAQEELAPSGAELDLDLTAAAPDATVDQDIGWLGDETILTPTQESEHVDLQTLSERATDDVKISQTLKDALSLLESDYEGELTASQVIDRTKLKEVLDANAEDDTLARTGSDRRPRR